MARMTVGMNELTKRLDMVLMMYRYSCGTMLNSLSQTYQLVGAEA
jgi:hypothetical protein